MLKPRAADYARRDCPLRSNAVTRFDQTDRFDFRATVRPLDPDGQGCGSANVGARCGCRTRTEHAVTLATHIVFLFDGDGMTKNQLENLSMALRRLARAANEPIAGDRAAGALAPAARGLRPPNWRPAARAGRP